MKNILSGKQNTFTTIDSLLKNRENDYFMIVDHVQLPGSEGPEYTQMIFRYGMLPDKIELIAGPSRKNKTVEIVAKDNYYSQREGILGNWEKKEGNLIIPSNKIIIASEFKKCDEIILRSADTTEFYFADSALNFMYALILKINRKQEKDK